MPYKELKAIWMSCVSSSFRVENFSSGSLQEVLLTHNPFSSGNSWQPRNLILFWIPHVCKCLKHSFWLSSKRTFPNTHPGILLPKWHQTQTPLLRCISLHKALSLSCFPQGEVRVLNCLAQPLADSYHLWRYLLAALHGSQDGCISGVSSLMSRIKLYAWQSVPKWILCYLQV